MKHEDEFIEKVLNQECLPKCPLECYDRSLQPATVTSYTFPQENSFRTLYQSNTEISVSYDSLSYTQVEEEPKITLEDVIAMIGGHLHVFLGMSLLSFVELFELIAIVILVSVNTKKHNGDNKRDNKVNNGKIL